MLERQESKEPHAQLKTPLARSAPPAQPDSQERQDSPECAPPLDQDPRDPPAQPATPEAQDSQEATATPEAQDQLDPQVRQVAQDSPAVPASQVSQAAMEPQEPTPLTVPAPLAHLCSSSDPKQWRRRLDSESSFLSPNVSFSYALEFMDGIFRLVLLLECFWGSGKVPQVA